MKLKNINFFNEFVSNTYAGSGNQMHFSTAGKIRTGRIFYKISVGGKFRYSILFSNIIDSTFEDGLVSHSNLICDEWHIYGLIIGKSKDICDDILNCKELTFNGGKGKNVMPGELFYSDPVEMEFSTDEYLCMEITYSGEMIPYHEETLLPSFVKEGDGWKSSRLIPFASMIGCDRKVKGKVAYLGDSITQGIGTEPNSYKHWNAILSEKLGKDYSYWNLGLGYGRASDAASDGAWLYKAKQNDIVVVCYGVNDILMGDSEEKIKNNLERIVDILIKNEKKVVLQTVPPFNYEGENITKWDNINWYIKNVLVDKVDIVFDNVPQLGNNKTPYVAKYGGHPGEEGCSKWASALYEEIKYLFR